MTAEMIPEWFSQGPDAELQVWRSLRSHLSEAWTVWHSLAYPLTISPGKRPGEIDFICAHRDLGVAVIEVKGGVLTFEGGRWFQDGYALKQSPFKQVVAAGGVLKQFLCEKWACKKLPFAMVHLVWFPAVNRVENEPFEAAGCTLYEADLKDPARALERALGSVGGATEKCDCREVLKAVLTPLTRYCAQWQTRRTLADARLLKLTMEQARTLDAFVQFSRLRVRGCAGSGKTVLALRRAYQLVEQGKRVLFLCFNLLLAEHLRGVAKGVEGLKIIAVNDLFQELLGREATGDPDFWHQLARDVKGIAATVAQTSGYNAVIVDEGQDFSPLMWEAVTALVPDAADFIIFYDPRQNIFQRELDAMPTFPWPDAVLTQNCRNTRAVGELLQSYAPHQLTISEDAPTGESPEWYHAETKEALRERLLQVVARLTEKEGVPLGEIVVLGAHARSKMALERVVERYPTMRYFTYRKFKGLEAPVLILLDVDENNPLWNEPARYAAISRAVHKLIVLSLN